MTMFKKLLFFAICCFQFITNVYGQNGKIEGVVLDEKDNKLSFATVAIQGTSIGTQTDLEGKFSLINLTNGEFTFVVSFVGYKINKQAVTITNGSSINLTIKLVPEAAMLKEVVTIGYGTRKSKDFTGSVSTIRQEEIKNTPLKNVTEALQGRASGVQVISQSGVLGSGFKVQIRGTSSINASSEPLYVIDGIPVEVKDIGAPYGNQRTSTLNGLVNPNDVEKIEVLKDATATAIYGSRGANGVVMITTKKGKSGKTTYNFNYYQGLSTFSNVPDFLTAREQLDLTKTYYKERFNSTITENSFVGGYKYKLIDSLANAGGTNWIKEVTRKGQTRDANLSALGGNEFVKYFISATLQNNKGFLKNNNLDKIGTQLNLTISPSKKITLGSNNTIAFTQMDRVDDLGRTQQLLPYRPIYQFKDTSLLDNAYDNPIWKLATKSFNTKEMSLISNIYFDIKLAKHLSFRSDNGANIIYLNEKEFNFKNLQDPGSLSNAWSRNTNVNKFVFNNYVTYANQIKQQHEIDNVFGMSYENSATEGTGLYGQGFVSDALTNPGLADKKDGYSYNDFYRFLSLYNRTNYKFRDKYIATVSLRSDGATPFGENNKYALFPAGAVAWILSDEDFLKDKKWLSFAKFKTSFGYNGNAGIPSNAYVGSYAISTANGYGSLAGLVPSQLNSPNLTWEKNRQLDVAFDYGFFNDRVTGSFTFYNKVTKSLLVRASIPTSAGLGANPAWTNRGKIRNRGFEASLSAIIINKKIKWSTDFNIAFNNTNVLDAGGIGYDDDFGEYREGRIIEGYPVGILYLIKYAGVQEKDGFITVYNSSGTALKNLAGKDSTAKVFGGQALYYDRNGNIMTENVHPESDIYKERVAVGRPNPKFLGGMSHTISWKGLELNVFVNYVYGNQLYDAEAKFQSNPTNVGNMILRKEVLDYWTTTNTQTNIPALKYSSTVNSTRYLYDGSYLRLKRVQLAYSLPSKWMSKAKVSSLKVFVTGTNLFTWVNKEFKGWDPEVLPNTSYGSAQSNVAFAGVSWSNPQMKTIQFGLNLIF
jgi:TonB-linked SusC/RagA family outer membrane protein